MERVRVSIPKKKRELISLAQKVLSKHQLDAEQSKLNVLDWSKFDEKIQQALAMQNTAEDLARKSKLTTEQCDLLLQDIHDHLRSSRDVLTGVFKSEMKKLGDWGYDVIESARVAKAKKEAV